MDITKLFLFSSCSVWTSALDNKWVTNTEVIQSHYLDEIIQYVKWFTHKDTLNDKELKCFRNEITQDNFHEYKKKFTESQVILLEISSLKISEENHLFYNLLNNKQSEVKDLQYLKYRICELFKLLKNKNIVLVSHVNTYSPKIMGFIKNRITIQELCKYAHKKFNVPVISPTKFLCKYGEDNCLFKSDGENDINHFSPFMFNLITEEIISVVAQNFGLKLVKYEGTFEK